MATVKIIPQTTGFLVEFVPTGKMSIPTSPEYHAAETYAVASAKGKKLLDEDKKKIECCKGC